MSDQTNEPDTPNRSSSGPPGPGRKPDAEAAARAASDAAARAAEAAMNDPMPSEADAQAIGSAADTARAVREQAEAAAGGDGPGAFNLEQFEESAPEAGQSPISLLDDVNLDVKIELGRTRMFVEDVLKLNNGAVVELDKLAGDPVDIYVNNRHVARGEVLVLNDNFCVRISEILDPSTDDTKK